MQHLSSGVDFKATVTATLLESLHHPFQNPHIGHEIPPPLQTLPPLPLSPCRSSLFGAIRSEGSCECRHPSDVPSSSSQPQSPTVDPSAQHLSFSVPSGWQTPLTLGSDGCKSEVLMPISQRAVCYTGKLALNHLANSFSKYFLNLRKLK